MAENVLRDLSYFEGYDTSTSPRKLNPTSPKKQTKQNDRKLHVMEDTPQIKRERLEIRERQSVLSTLKIMAVAVLSIVVIGSLVFQRATINNLSRQISQKQIELAEVKSENTRLSLKLESLKTPKIVGEFAESKGMIQRDSYTINYFDLSSKDIGYAF